MRPYRRLSMVTISVLMVLFCAAPLSASIRDIRMYPTHPTSQDSLRITVIGELPDGCWRLDKYSCQEDRNIEMYLVDRYAPGTLCPVEAPPPYIETCRYGPLPVGYYGIVVIEYHDSVRIPDFDYRVVFFTVSPPTATGPVTWGRIKLLYR